MKLRWLGTVVLGSAVLSGAPGALGSPESPEVKTGSPALTQRPQEDALPTWLVGCWSSTGSPEVGERWGLAGDVLIGVGTTVAAGHLREFELLRIVTEGPVESPTVAYLAQPGGAPPTRFARASSGPAEVVFANPAHDFPKRVGYRRTGDALLAWIDGGTDSSKRVEFPMRKVPCER